MKSKLEIEFNALDEYLKNAFYDISNIIFELNKINDKDGR